jgi:hypothetical protein
MAEIHVGDVGTVFRVTVVDEDGVVIDISSATVLQIWFEDPTGSVSVQTAALTNSGTDGKMQYMTASASDLATDGPWRLQGYVELGGAKIHTDIHKFKVKANLK